MSEHSPILGGSTAERLLNCPASYSETMRSPLVDVSSSYADYGTAMHELLARCYRELKRPDSFLGEVFHGQSIGPDEVLFAEDSIAMLNELLDAIVAKEGGGKFKVLAVEEWLPMPGIAGAGGTVDLILINKKFAVIVDWKSGVGVGVRAAYPIGDGSEEALNAQPVFYTIGAVARYPKTFTKKRRIVMAIVQPRIEDGLSYAEVSYDELAEFHEAFKAAVTAAMSRNPHRQKGNWCRFAPCKATCELWTGKVFDLAVIDPVAAAMRDSVKLNGATSFGQFLSSALDLAEIAEQWATEIRKQAHLFIDSGAGVVPGWVLVPKRANRSWIDPAQAVLAITALGVPVQELYEEKLKSVAQAEKVCKSRGVPLPEALYQQVSSGTTLAPAGDPRPAVDRQGVVERVAIALKAL